MLLRKVHKIILYKQTSWLRVYIELNNQKKSEVKTGVEKSCSKLFNIAVYGKAMENVDKKKGGQNSDKLALYKL